MSGTSTAAAGSAPLDTKELNPNAKAFSPPAGGGKSGRPDHHNHHHPKNRGGGSRQHQFIMNPEAKPWLPSSYQTPTASKKPVIVLFGAPGGGAGELGKSLAADFGGRCFSSTQARREAIEERRQRFDSRPESIWCDVGDTLTALDRLLEETVNDPSVKGYFLDINSRNNAIFHYVSWVLKQHALAPAQVFYLQNPDRSLLVKSLVQTGEEESSARKQVDYYYAHEKERLRTFDGVRGLLRTVDAGSGSSYADEVRQHTQVLFQKVLSFSIPHVAPSHGLTPVDSYREYTHVLNVVSNKVSGGDARWPAAKEAGTFALADDGSIFNPKAPKDPVPSSKTHLLSKKTDGTKYLLVYTPVYNDQTRGRFYLLPKQMDVIYTFRPRIGDTDYEDGCGPLYGEAGDLMTVILEGELVATKTGWGGLQGMGCQQSFYAASDVLYFEGEKPRDRIVKHEQWTLPRRLELLSRNNWPADDAAPTDTKTVSLCIKTYYPVYRLPQVLHAVTTQSDAYHTTGLVFSPLGKYTLYSDPHLICWHAPAHRRINLFVEKAKEQPKDVNIKYVLKAKKAWNDEELLEVGEALDVKTIADGNATCRVIWTEKPDKYQWVVDGPATNCWEKSGLDAYLDAKFWIDNKVLADKLYEPVPQVEKKTRVEKAGDDDIDDPPGTGTPESADIRLGHSRGSGSAGVKGGKGKGAK